MNDTATAYPVQPDERIVTIDVLRAFALLGILVVNMMGFATSFWSAAPLDRVWTSWYDRGAVWLIDWAFSGKFNSLFSFLFGYGFTIQMERLARRGSGWQWIYARRLFFLMLFGIAHALFLWTGDVLHVYAIIGAVLLAVRRIPEKWILIAAAALILLPTCLSTYRTLHFTPEMVRERRAVIERMHAETTKAYSSGSYADATRMRAAEMKEFYSTPWSLTFFASMTVTMLLGFYAGRRRLVQDAAQHAPFIRRVQRWSLLLGFICATAFAVGLRFAEPFKPTLLWPVLVTAYAFARPSLMLFYAATLVRMCLSERWAPRLAPLAYVGRMPLTNYLMQSLICTSIFYGYGLGFYNKCGPAAGLLLSVAIWGLQIPISMAWLSRFRFGPAEWLWRALTYGHRPEMRRELKAAAAGA